MFSKERALEIVDYADKNGDEEAKDHFSFIHIDSIRRARNLLKTDNDIYTVPKILVLDIETAPNRAYVWGKWKQNVNNFISQWFMLTWSAKWLNDEKVYSDRVNSKEAKSEDDLRILKSISKLLNEADYVIAHNGVKFDFPRINSRLAVNNLLPVTPYMPIDTCRLARKHFGFLSNKLDDLLSTFGLEGKTSTGFELWERCINGDNKALKEMEEYNINDVVILEELYKKIRPYVKGLPSVSQSMTGRNGNIACTVCGSENVKFEGHYRTNQNIFRSYRCNDCGAIAGRERKSIVKDKNELVPVSR